MPETTTPDDLADRLEVARPARLCSAVSVWERVLGLCRSHGLPVAEARKAARGFMSHHEFRFVSIGEPELDVAADAYARFGKGRHPAALNMGDCYAYACTTTNQARLLFKGGGFGHTDIDQAI